MLHKMNLLGAAALILSAGAGLAQTAVTGVDTLSTRIDDIDRAAQIDLARANDPMRYGAADAREGMSGSLSMGFGATSGATDSNDFTLGARLRFANGPFIQNFAAAIDRSETGGTSTKEDLFAIYDANYFWNDRFYGFVLGRIKYDGLASAATDVKTDAFIGVGPGYRVINTPDVSWRLQAGIGVSHLEDGTAVVTNEMGYIASSRLYLRISDTMFATNDTDMLQSDTALRVNNDLGLNFKMSEAFATRISYLTEFNDSRAVQTENKLGVSLVMSI